jgi:hypothetical protein
VDWLARAAAYAERESLVCRNRRGLGRAVASAGHVHGAQQGSLHPTNVNREGYATSGCTAIIQIDEELI